MMKALCLVSLLALAACADGGDTPLPRTEAEIADIAADAAADVAGEKDAELESEIADLKREIAELKARDGADTSNIHTLFNKASWAEENIHILFCNQGHTPSCQRR